MTDNLNPKDKAFLGSDNATLGDLKLQPWTPDRINAAQRMGMFYPNLGKGGWDRVTSTSVYPGVAQDVMIFVYLSTVEPKKVYEVTFEDAMAFGTARNLHSTDSKEFWDAYNKFIDVQNEIQASRTTVKASPGAGTIEEEEEPGNE